ncbi:ParB family protein [Sodalis sp. RH19]|uniref:ParB family protein n=1 Tax=Sodalis sp. RH19 TaxID=3394334 RepID=UPI0039B49C5A
MPDISPQDMAVKLMADGFTRTATVANTLSDPISDTPIIVTLDELRPYELDPRLTRNPLYEEIKASIHERGLDAPPPITRRPDADHYIIRNGGNTRLAILRELWAETREARFFRISCLFRPWPDRGEIIALTGHLAEDELHGRLSFIERALGVERARELYEQETGKSPSQSELARRLKADGYPVPQPHISRMQETIQYLLPAIPTVLFAGLGRPQIEQLTSLRRAGARAWESLCTTKSSPVDFPTLFQDVLALFDNAPGNFSAQRVQDELIGQMSELLGVEYDTLAFEIFDAEKRWQILSSEASSPPVNASKVALSTPQQKAISPATSKASTLSQPAPVIMPPKTAAIPRSSVPSIISPVSSPSGETPPDGQDEGNALLASVLQEHIVTPAGTTERLESIQQLIADHTGQTHPDFEQNVLRAIPVQVGGLYPITDIWYIDPTLDEPGRLRTHIAQFASEIASEAGDADNIETCEIGIGFRFRQDAVVFEPLSSPVLSLLHALSATYDSADYAAARAETLPLANVLGHLLLGTPDQASPSQEQFYRLSDSGLVKLFRLLRLARRLMDIEAGIKNSVNAVHGS